MVIIMIVMSLVGTRLKTNKWVLSFNYTYAYVAGVLTCLCLCYAYACAYAYALVRTSLKKNEPTY